MVLVLWKMVGAKDEKLNGRQASIKDTKEFSINNTASSSLILSKDTKDIKDTPEPTLTTQLGPDHSPPNPDQVLIL